MDPRNIQDKYKNWVNELIKEDVQGSSFPYAILMTQLSGDFNFGSVVRSANGFGASEIFYYGNKRFDRRSAVGTYLYSKVTHLPDLNALIALKQRFTFVGLENIPQATSLKEFSWKDNSLILLGEEGQGLPGEILSLCDSVVQIPMRGSVRSFNAASAASIAMYDLVSKNFM